MLQIENLDSSALLKLFDGLNKRFDELAPAVPNDPDTYMTRQEVADLFKISLPTVHAWMNTGILKYYKIANKTRFLRGEVLAAVTAIKQKGGSHE